LLEEWRGSKKTMRYEKKKKEKNEMTWEGWY